MIHQNDLEPSAKSCIKQVEFNTIASSFGGLASKVCSLHKLAPIPELLTKLTTVAFSTRLMRTRLLLLLPSILHPFPQTPPSPPYPRVLHSVTGRMALRSPRRSFPSAFFLWCKAPKTISSTNQLSQPSSQPTMVSQTTVSISHPSCHRHLFPLSLVVLWYTIHRIRQRLCMKSL